MKKLLFLALVATSFSVASCDNKQKDAANKEGDAVKAAGDAEAAKLEASADSTKKTAEKKADAIREEKK
jgi:uncharacterized lipoprotein NlpE involved in copper resistance